MPRTRGMSSPCIYTHPTEICIRWRHGDDIIIAGEKELVLKIKAESDKDMILKQHALLGWNAKDDKHITVLN
eukprot:1634725-Karenia_brevis.AAC.1